MEEMPILEEAPLSSSSPGKIRKQNTIAVMQNEQLDGASSEDGGDEAFSVTNSKMTHHNSEILSQTLPSGYKYNTMTPTKRKNSDKEKRRSVAIGMFRRSKDEDQLQESDITPPMEISGPEQRQFDWRKRRVKGVRTTLRRRTKSTPSQADLIPDLSYCFEVSYYIY